MDRPAKVSVGEYSTRLCGDGVKQARTVNDRIFDPDRWRERVYRDSRREHQYEGQRGEAFSERQAAFRADLRTVLGHHLVGGCSSAERDTRRVGVVRRDGYERQEWSIRTEPGMQAPFYLLLPSDYDPPYPIVITVHGHNETGKELAVGEYCDER